MIPKFRVGDKLELIKDTRYFSGLKKGGIATVSEVNASKYENEVIYGFEEDTGRGGRPNWLLVDRNFILVKVNWRRRLEQ